MFSHSRLGCSLCYFQVWKYFLLLLDLFLPQRKDKLVLRSITFFVMTWATWTSRNHSIFSSRCFQYDLLCILCEISFDLVDQDKVEDCNFDNLQHCSLHPPHLPHISSPIRRPYTWDHSNLISVIPLTHLQAFLGLGDPPGSNWNHSHSFM